MAGEGEEDVVEIGGVDRELVDVDRLGVELVQQGLQRADAAVAGERQGELVFVAGDVAEGASGRFELAGVGEAQADVTARDEPLELVRGALGDQLPAVENRDVCRATITYCAVRPGVNEPFAIPDPVRAALTDRLVE